MVITPKILQVTYVFLKAFEPFQDMPPAHDVQFKINRCDENRGYFHQGGGSKEYLIMVSARCINHMDSLVKVMSHEMLHMKQYIDDTETEDVVHNKEFTALGQALCLEMGWDPGLF